MSESTAYPQFVGGGNRVSRRLEECVAELKELTMSPGRGPDGQPIPSPAAKAHVDYLKARALRKIRAREQEGAKSVAESDVAADADDEIYAMHLAKTTMEGSIDALRHEIQSLRSRLSWGQSVLSAEREVDKQHALAGGIP